MAELGLKDIERKGRIMKRIKRFVAVILSLAIIITGIHWSDVSADEVHAATTTVQNRDMLNVKVQVAKDDNTNVMRFVSSVDSLNYRKVGFEIAKEGETPNRYDITTVYKRIESILEDEHLKYTFSPKVIDTSAEYFMTGLWNAEPGVNYTVRAYAVTFQNQWIYGDYRCVALKDGRSTTTHLNMSFEASENHQLKAEDTIPVTYGANNTETTATVINTNGTTVHVRVQNVKYSDLPSVTKFTFGEYGSAIFRNLYTEYSETRDDNKVVIAHTADTSWYDVYIEENEDENEFVIASNADMYGFMHLMNGTTADGTTEVFGGKTVYLVSDIKMNDVTEGVTAKAWANGETTSQFNWSTQCISNDNSTQFQGIFDGQMHTISGVYMNAESTCVGLFGVTAPGSVVKNFYLTESYFSTTYEVNTTYNDLSLGSVIGYCRGSVDTVYSNAIVKATQTNGRRIGGIVGNLNSNSNTQVATVNNCWFDGTVYLNYQQGGGIVGYIAKNTVYISNCLYTGMIQSATDGTNISYVGGIIGTNDGSTAHVNDCVSAGVINAKSSYGSIMGSIRVASSSYHFANTYGTGTDKALGSKTKGATISSICANVEENALKGISAYNQTLLDFEDVWQARENEVPALKSFRNKLAQSSPIDVNNYPGAAQSQWYHSTEYQFTYDSGTTVETYSVKKYNIHSLSALEGFRDYVNSGTTFATMEVYLNTDIDLNPGWKPEVDKNGMLSNSPEKEWSPIGTESTKSFWGTFNGGGHTISGLYVDAQKAGLFGYLANPATISQLQIVNSYLTGNSTATASGLVGSIAAEWYGGMISNVYSDAYIVANSVGYRYEVGGIVGRLGGDADKTMQTCWYDGTIMEASTSTISSNQTPCVGGLAGYNSAAGQTTIINSLNTGNLSNNANNTARNYYLGGLIGRTGVNEEANTTVVINKCLNLGMFTSSHSKTRVAPAIANIYGKADITISNSIALEITVNTGNVGAYVHKNNISNDDTTVQYADLTSFCTARASQTDETKALGFVGHANEDSITPAFLYMCVKGNTTGMNNVVQESKECIVLNNFKEFWLKHHGLEEGVPLRVQELYEQIEPYVKGAARVTREIDGIHFSRYTEAQYQNVDDRCTAAIQDATAGIRLHFKTNSTSLALKVRTTKAASESTPKSFSHDIYVDGVLKYSLQDTGNTWDDVCGDYQETYDLGEGIKEVCIYFPWSVNSVLTEFALDEGSTMEPVSQDKTMIFYGDSITNGRDASSPSTHYTAKLAEALGADWINKGVSGDVFRPAFAKLKDGGKYADPDYIVVAYGTNQFKTGSVASVTNAATGFFDALCKNYPNATILAVTPIWRTNAETAQDNFQTLWKLSDVIKDVVEGYDNVIAIDGTDLVPHNKSYYNSSDGLHPNDAGFAEYAKNLTAAIKSALGISE